MKKISLAIIAFTGLFAASAVFAATPVTTSAPIATQRITTSSQAVQITTPAQAGWMMRADGRQTFGQGHTVTANRQRGPRPFGMMIAGSLIGGITLLLVWSLLISATMALCTWKKQMKTQR